MEVPERAKKIIEKQRRPRNAGFTKTPLFQGVNLVTTDAVRQYIALLWKRYQTLKTRQEKSDVLDELCRNLSRHRKSALRLMNSHVRPRLGRGCGSVMLEFDTADPAVETVSDLTPDLATQAAESIWD